MKDQLIHRLEELTREAMNEDVLQRAEEIKNEYIAACEKNNETLLASFLEEGGQMEDFSPPTDPLDHRFNELMHILSDREKKQRQQLRDELKEKLAAKKEILEGLEKLSADETHIGKAFQQFKEFQNKWNDIGSIQHKDYKNMQAAYHRHAHNFYYNMKLSKDLRDLDFKRNLEQREQLLTKIESLVGMENIKAAERLYRLYRMEWSELGPTAPETIDELRNRYRELATQVQSKVSDFYQQQEGEQKKNLEIKTELLEKMKGIAGENFQNAREYQSMNERAIQLMKQWKETGFTTKDENERLWSEFKDAMNKFYGMRRQFFTDLKKEMKGNKEKKMALIAEAEEISNAVHEAYEAPASKLIELQKKWKEVGHTEHHEDNKLWTKFRSACDKFFEARKQKFADRDKTQQENLDKKLALIKNIEAYTSAGNTADDIAALQNFSAEWRSIEHVPFREKERVYNAYKKALDAKYNSLKLEQSQAHLMKFKTNIELLAQSEGAGSVLKKEKMFIQDRIKKLQSTITQYENNLGFFSNSKNMGGLLDEVQANLKKSKEEMVMLKDKLKLLNDASVQQQSLSTPKEEVEKK